MMTDAERRLTWWLRKAPKAVKFRLHTPDGPRDVVVSQLPKARWHAVAELVVQTGCTKIEALGEKDALIRATDIQADGEPPTDEEVPSANDAETAKVTGDAATLQLFARLLAEAYQKGAALQQQAMGQLVAALTQRTEELKKEGPKVPAPTADGGIDFAAIAQLAQAVPAIQAAIASMRGQVPPPAAAPKPNGVAS